MLWTYSTTGLGRGSGQRLRRLKSRDYSRIALEPSTRDVLATTTAAAKAIYGASWNLRSNALKVEVVAVLEAALECISSLRNRIDYLEIGSAQGVSMAFIGGWLKQRSACGELVSLDPYFENGYREGAHGPWRREEIIPIDDGTMATAAQLYRDHGLVVEQLRATSTIGLEKLAESGRRFDLIYIDGVHEGFTPTQDLVFSLRLLRRPGVLMLDDHHWPDVAPLREISERHLVTIAECWKVASFLVPQQDLCG